MTGARDTEIEPRAESGLVPAGQDTALRHAVRATIAPPAPGERYHVRGLTELWQHGLRSGHTRRSYTGALADWLDHCLRAGVDPLHARRADVDDWLAQHPQWSAATVTARLSGVASWYDYLAGNDIEVRDPVARVTRPARARGGSATPHLDGAGLNALLAAAAATAAGAPAHRRELAARELAVLRVLATTGVRSAAVQQAGVADVLAEHAGHRVLRYTGKGDGTDTGTRVRPLVPFAAAAVDDYLRLRAQRQDRPVAALTGPAFATLPYRGAPGDGRLSTGALTATIRAAATAAGLPGAGELTPHSLRHTVATLLLRHRSLAEVQDFLDHADPRTTRIYARTDTGLNNSPAWTMLSLLDDAPDQAEPTL